MSIVSEYLDEHKEVLLRDNPGRNESWLENEHMRKFIGWLRDQISQSDTHTSEYLKQLARGTIFTVVTYHGYDSLLLICTQKISKKYSLQDPSSTHKRMTVAARVTPTFCKNKILPT
jgi:hypothetical protein